MKEEKEYTTFACQPTIDEDDEAYYIHILFWVIQYTWISEKISELQERWLSWMSCNEQDKNKKKNALKMIPKKKIDTEQEKIEEKKVAVENDDELDLEAEGDEIEDKDEKKGTDEIVQMKLRRQQVATPRKQTSEHICIGWKQVEKNTKEDENTRWR
jgi:hypothetical protein